MNWLILYFAFLTHVSGFHYYADASEVKCFTEELSVDVSIVGAYKMTVRDSNTGLYNEVEGSSMKIVVHSVETNHNLVDTTGMNKGTFRFTAAETGMHKICMTPFVSGWGSSKTKIYMDIQYGPNDEDEAEKSDKGVKSAEFQNLKGMTEVIDRLISEIRMHLKSQKEIEEGVRELSEAVNSRTYQFTLIQMIILGLTCVWQLSQLKTFFQTKKLV